MQIVVTPAAAAASKASDPRDVALVHSEQPRPAAVESPKTTADFTVQSSLAGVSGSHFDPKRSKVISRSMFTEEYLNPDGTHSTRESTAPLNAKDAAGNWQPVDTGLQVDGSSKRANAKRQALNPSLAQRADDPAVVSVQVDGKTASLALDQAAPATAAVAGDKATYANVQPDTDLDYEVTASALKETVLLKKAPAKSSWRFKLKTGGLTPALDGDSVQLKDANGAVVVVLPPIETWDSSGSDRTAPARTGGTYGLDKTADGWWLTVSVDPNWLRDGKRVYPVHVDPTFAFGVNESHVYRTDGYSCLNCALQIGNSLNKGDSYSRSVFHFDYSSLWGKTVVGAKMDLTRDTASTGSLLTWNANLYHATAFDFNGVGEYLASANVGDVGTLVGDAFTNYLRDRVNARDITPFFMLIGAENPGTWTYKYLNATLTVDTGTAPPAPGLVTPADGSVLASLTPTLQVSPVTDPDGDPVKYCFKVATGSDAKSGVVVESGCLDSPQWTVPSGVLHDGVSYTWQATAYSGITTTTPTWIGHLKVDLRIGAHSPSPVDSAGPVAVNLANGDVSTTVATPTFTTVGGNAGLTFTYNSQQVDDKGLRASYFNDISHNGNISSSQQPVLVRNEPQVNVDYGTDSPFAPALGADYFVVRWEGYFQAPATGTYQFAGVHDDAAQVWINGNKVYTSTGVSDLNWTQATGVALTQGQRVPIKVELQEITGAARMRLFTRTADGTTVPAQIVPADWLFSGDLPALPKGWTLSADLDGNGTTYTTAQVTDQNVVLTDGTGAKHTWTKKSAGGYSPPLDEDGVLALDSGGRVTLTEGSDVFVFRADGKLDSQSATADSRKPAALQNIYDGDPSRLSQIKDPVSGRAHVLHYNRAGDDCYGGATPPSGADTTAPSQMLCRISYWDGTETRLWYSGGRLSRVEDPGSQVTDFGYDADSLLTSSRSSLVNDWIAADPANRSGATDVVTAVAYDKSSGKPKGSGVTQAAPAPGQPRPGHGYRYDPANRISYVDTVGLSPAVGFTTKVAYDDADRVLSSTDATGRTTSQSWNVKDQQLTSTDAAGRVTTNVYDYDDRVTDNYGPAPASCFAGQLPTAACANTVPHKHTNYDENINGLSVAYYDNLDLAGAPKVYGTGVGEPSGKLVANYSATTPPVAGLSSASFAARFTGEIQFPDAGTYTIKVWVDDGVRVWIDDQLIVDAWADGGSHAVSGTYNNTDAGAYKRIRVDYYNRVDVGLINLNWIRPGQAEENVPGQYLKPRYGLTTSSTSSESNGVPDKTSASRFGDGNLDPTFGLPGSTVNDPAGLALASTAGYEAVGSGYLRRTSEAKPSGATTAYAFYGDTETRANPCVAGSAATNQGGLPKLTTAATPAAGSARTDEDVYDASGRVVAKATSGDWACTSYDSRDRVVQQTYPANPTAGARTVSYDYAVGGDPLTSSVTDYNGTVTTKLDLLGRTVSYTDAAGVRTDSAYDQIGRTASTTVTPPNQANSPLATTSTYDDAGRLLTTKLGTTVLATVTYDAAGELASVAYANGSALSAVGKDAAGQGTSLTWNTSDGKQIVSQVTRSRAGTITDESLGGLDPNPTGANYVYDGMGRLTQAFVTGHHYTYDFTSAAAAACPTGTQANAGRDTNRVRLLDQTGAGTAETDYCYDAADRLLATVGATALSGFQYDSHGNTTQFSSGGTTSYFGFDSGNRNVSARTTSSDPNQVADISYTRDVLNRIVRRDAHTGDGTTAVLYGYTGTGDSASLTMDGNKNLQTFSIVLPGGVLYTKQVAGGQDTWDAPSVRGDLSVTTNGSGVQVGSLRTYTPYGEALRTDGTVDNQAVPDNQPGNMDYGWLGQNQREYEHAGALSLVQMGERPYSPLLGRFLSVDPVDGGSANDYDYVNADPINHVDLDGTSFWGWLGNTVKSAFTDHLTTTLSVLAVATSWVPFVGVAFTVAAAVSSGYDAYNDFRHGDILGGILDIAGGFTGVGGLVKHAAAYAAKKAAAKLFTKAKSFRGVANSGRWARKAARQGAKQVRAAARYSAREKRYTRYGIAATALYEGSAQVRSRYHF
ncbi:PA14 domain-containing protein [Kutzneria chonburiensis]|uniref:PA14 domain-containing protein n=1 Tax=Kutzneria chonburiensis TaxID=1483604 RepID=A0ABV6MQK8_9PSEU|nr:PA14 domain-containing protein [Kutzneria chonburiensis]